MLGPCPRHQDAPVEPSQSSGLGNGSCLISDIRSTIHFSTHLEGDRGQVRLQMAGRTLTLRPRIRPLRTAASFAEMSSTCQFVRNGLGGPSSRKQHAAKLAKSSCSSAARRVPADERRRRGQRAGSKVAAAGISAASAAIWRRNRATNWSTTSRSGAVNLAGSRGAARPSARPPSSCRTAFWWRANRP
jgi:hypothetical protein